MTARNFSIDVIRKLTAAGFVAYWAGGCVRDLLLGHTPHDFDVATTATPDQVRDLFGKKRTLAVGESFGVMIVLGPKSAGHIEVATFRREGTYLDGRRPESVEYCSAEEDSHRRDFTVNGMFYDPLTEQVHDFVGGTEDLGRKLIRAIGHPEDRMAEDKLRLLRAVRFTAVLEFELDPQTAAAVKAMAHQIIVVSAERITQELHKMLAHYHRARAVQLCEELGLLAVILPEVTEHSVKRSCEHWKSRLRLLEELQTNSCEVGMAALLRDVPYAADSAKQQAVTRTVQNVCNRLKLSNHEKAKIQWLVEHKECLNTFEEWSLAEQKKIVVHDDFADLLEIERTAASIENRSPVPFAAIQEFLRCRTLNELNPPEILTGKSLIEVGLKPGPQFQIWIQAARDAQLNELISTPEEALELVLSLQ